MQRIGFLGLGKMGAVMAPRFIDAGFPLTVWNRSADKTTALRARGAMVGRAPADVTADADIVVTMLRDDAAAEEVYLGQYGLLSTDAKGKLFIEMSTLRPATARALAERCAEHGAGFIDAPVSGTVGPAKEGKLMALVGGSDADVGRARPALAVMTRRIVHAGPVGQGAMLKLVLNLQLAVYWEALGEAMALGRAADLDLAVMLDAMADSGASARVLAPKIPLIVDGSEHAAFDIATMEKDAKSILAVGAELGVPMPTLSAALATYSAAHAAGLGDADAVAVVRYLSDKVAR
ncbi:MAG TPA: NAD(P)-dependent oxidoreductase [Gammaproteobacteria bacterium]|nr:NAD(P)-dependent oxidoreductase [Gammaproteobacteria bacterium]